MVPLDISRFITDVCKNLGMAPVVWSAILYLNEDKGGRDSLFLAMLMSWVWL